MLTLNDGRSELWQWDTGRTLSVERGCTQVHFSNKVFGRSIDVDVVDGIAVIPDILLQTDKELTAWAFVGTPENGYTKISKIFKVNKRNKPADYVFTAPDQTTLGDILDRIEDLENRPSGDISEEDIQNAVNDYLEKNPVSVDEKDPTVPAWAKEPKKPPYTAEEVGALPADTKIPDAPDLSGYVLSPKTAKVGQTIVVQSVDENGKPTEWEAADFPAGGSGDSYELINTINLTEEVSTITIDTDSNGNSFSLKKILVYAFTKGGTNNTDKSNYHAYPNTVNAGLIRSVVEQGIYAAGGAVSSIVEYEALGDSTFLFTYGANASIKRALGSHISSPDTIQSFNLHAVTTDYTFGVGTNLKVYGVRA